MLPLQEVASRTEFHSKKQKACRTAWNAYHRERYGAVTTTPRSHATGGRPATCTITEVFDLYHEGLTRREIALKIGCSYQAVTSVFTPPAAEGIARRIERDRYEANRLARGLPALPDPIPA